jgi:hypothetical protein
MWLRQGAPAVAVLAVAAAVVACSTSSSGPTHDVCGERIGSANMTAVPWFADATAKSVAISVPGDDPDAGVWVLVSNSCKSGATLQHSDHSVARFSDVVRAADGRYAAVRITSSAIGPETDVITLTESSGTTRTVTVGVTR